MPSERDRARCVADYQRMLAEWDANCREDPELRVLNKDDVRTRYQQLMASKYGPNWAKGFEHLLFHAREENEGGEVGLAGERSRPSFVPPPVESMPRGQRQLRSGIDFF